MGRLQYIPSFYFYKFANAIADPYTSLDAYRSGLIDGDGNITGNEGSIDSFEYFIIKLKKIFEQLPPGMTRYKLSNLIGTMQLFSEEAEYFGISKEQFNMLVEAEVTSLTNGSVSYIELLEDMGTTVAGGAGEPGGLGVPAEAPQTNKGGISGYDPRMGSILRRAEPVNMVGAVEMFNVSAEEFNLFKMNKYYPKTATGNYIRRFGHRNPSAKIAIRNEETGEVFWLPKANKKMLGEEIFDSFQDVLNESIGKRNILKFGRAQYKGIGHFLSNHITNSHNLNNNDDISIIEDETGQETKVKTPNFRQAFSDILTQHHEQNRRQNTFTVKTAKGNVNVKAPHVASRDPNDLTISDSLLKKEVNVDLKGGRGRWETADKIDGPGLFAANKFTKQTPRTDAFIAFHDAEGNVNFVDTPKLTQTTKIASQFYRKSGSSERPGTFVYPGEVNIRTTKRGERKALRKGIDIESGVIPKSSKKEFPKAMAKITGVNFGQNDMYTSMLRKGLI